MLIHPRILTKVTCINTRSEAFSSRNRDKVIHPVCSEMLRPGKDMSLLQPPCCTPLLGGMIVAGQVPPGAKLDTIKCPLGRVVAPRQVTHTHSPLSHTRTHTSLLQQPTGVGRAP